MRRDQNKISTFENLHGGFRKAVGVGGSVTGMGADFIIADDPINPKNAFSEVHLKRCRDWWDLVFQNRLNNHQIGLRIIVMQRLHERDLTGHVLGKRNKKWRLIRIPGENGFPIEPDHLRGKYKNGLFFPKRLTKEDLEKFKEDYGSAGYAGQIGQSPAPVDGDIFKKNWVSRYEELPKMEFPLYRQSWDLSFKSGSNSSYVVGQTWVTDGTCHWLVDVVRRKMAFVETRKAMLAFFEKWPDVQVVLVEDKANGPGIIDDLKGEIPQIEAVGKSRSKEENAHAASVLFEAGKVFIPEGVIGDEFVNELLTFPHGAYDDQVDAATQYLIYAKQSYYDIRGMTLF